MITPEQTDIFSKYVCLYLTFFVLGVNFIFRLRHSEHLFTLRLLNIFKSGFLFGSKNHSLLQILTFSGEGTVCQNLQQILSV